MEKKEQNYIRQLLLELEDYLFSLSWYDGEDRLKTFRDVSNIKSIFQLVPKRYLKLLEGRVYTQQELSKAREEGAMNVFTKEEWFDLKLAMNDIFNNGNHAYEGISKKIQSELNKLSGK